MDRWVNKAVDGAGVFYTRIIASWIRMKYGTRDTKDFKEWLRTLKINGKPLTDEMINDICFLKDNGKLELEESARDFIVKKIVE